MPEKIGRRGSACPEASGLFGQVTANALAATLLVIFVAIERRGSAPSITKKEARLAFALAAVALALSTRAKPLLILAAVPVFLYLKQLGLRPLVLATLAAATPVLVTLGLVALAPVGEGRLEENAGTSTGNVLSHAIPRVQFMEGAQRLASRDFPLGAGTGAYGSDLEQGKELELFADVGLAGKYGFVAHKAQFNSDNFVAHVLGERGYLGLALWLLSLIALIYLALISDGSAFAACVVVAAATVTPIEPVFRDSTAALLPFVPAMLCLTWSRRPAVTSPSRRPAPVRRGRASRRASSMTSTLRVAAQKLRPRSPMLRARSGSARIAIRASARATASSRGTRTPFPRAAPGIPPTGVLTNGRPALMASVRIMGIPSAREGSATTRAERNRALTVA